MVLEAIVVIAGLLLGGGVLTMIFKGVEVSTGHSVIMGLLGLSTDAVFKTVVRWNRAGPTTTGFRCKL